MAGLNLSDFDFSGVQTVGAQQGDGGKLAAAWESVRSKAPDYQGLLGTGIATRANEKNTGIMAAAGLASAPIGAEDSGKAAKLPAETSKNAGRETEKGSMFVSV